MRAQPLTSADAGREGGFIVIRRRIRSWPLWVSLTGEQRAVVVELLLSANWRPTVFWFGTTRIEVGRGELIASEEALATASNTSRKVVRTVLAKLLHDQFITRRVALGVSPQRGPKTGRCPHVITIVNYDKYQSLTEEEGQQEGQQRGQRRANSGPATGLQGAPSEPIEPIEPWEPEIDRARAPSAAPSPPARRGDGLRSTPFAELKAEWFDGYATANSGKIYPWFKADAPKLNEAFESGVPLDQLKACVPRFFADPWCAARPTISLFVSKLPELLADPRPRTPAAGKPSAIAPPSTDEQHRKADAPF